MTRVRFASPLRKLTQGLPCIETSAHTVMECLEELKSRFPDLVERIFDPDGTLKEFMMIFVNNEDIRFLQEFSTPLHADDEVNILPPVTGG